MLSLSAEEARLLRLRAQRLHPQRRDSAAGVAQVVKDLCGVQAQDTSAAALALRARSTGMLASDIERARVQERAVLRTWRMRGTLHLLAPEDVEWILALVGPAIIATSKRRLRELGLELDTCSDGIQAIRDALANRGSLTRPEIVNHLALHGINLAGQASYHQRVFETEVPHYTLDIALPWC